MAWNLFFFLNLELEQNAWVLRSPKDCKKTAYDSASVRVTSGTHIFYSGVDSSGSSVLSQQWMGGERAHVP